MPFLTVMLFMNKFTCFLWQSLFLSSHFLIKDVFSISSIYFFMYTHMHIQVGYKHMGT